MRFIRFFIKSPLLASKGPTTPIFRCLKKLMYLSTRVDPLIGFKTMNIPADDSKEQVFDDLRQLMARQAKMRDERARSLFGLLRSGLAAANGCLIQLLESRIIVALALCLCIVFAALLMQVPRRDTGLTDVIASSKIDQKARSEETLDARRDSNAGDDFGPDQAAGNFRSSPREESSIAKTNDAFFVKVGAFRDPSNAKRIVERLRNQTLEVKTEVFGGDLFVVMLGPFSQKGAAEEIARTVHDAMGLAPEVLRQNIE